MQSYKKRVQYLVSQRLLYLAFKLRNAILVSADVVDLLKTSRGHVVTWSRCHVVTWSRGLVVTWSRCALVVRLLT